MVTKKPDDGGSIFKTALVAAPAAIGAGVTAGRLMRENTIFGPSIQRLPNAAANSAIAGFTERYIEKPFSKSLKTWQAKQLDSFAGNTVLTTEQLRTAWLNAAKVADPTGITASSTADQMLGKTPQQIMQDIRFKIQTSSSPYVARTAEIFLEDVGVMNHQLVAGKDISTVSISNRVPSKYTRITPGEVSRKMRKDILNIKSQLGLSELEITRVSRGDVPGHQLRVKMAGGRIGADPIFMNVPGAFPGKYQGIVTRGSTQQSRYIAGMYGVVEGGLLKESFNHEEYMMRRFLEGEVPRLLNEKKLTSRIAQSMVHEFESKMGENLDWVQTLPSGQHQGWDESIKLRSKIMRLRTTTGDPLSMREYASVIEQGGAQLPSGKFVKMLPGYSPAQIAKGTVSLADYRGLSSLIPESEDIGRRPMQWMRPEYAPTKEAIWQMQHMSPATKKFAWAGTKAGVYAPMAKTAYVSTRHTPSLIPYGITEEGMGVISSEMSAAREVEQIVNMDINADRVSKQLSTELKGGGAHWQIGKKAAKGTFFGYGPEGRPVVLPETMEIVQATKFSKDKSKGDFIRVIGRKTVSEGEYSKVYLGAKMMAKEARPAYIREAMKNINMGHLAEVDAIVTMGELKKNRRLHYNQLFTSLYEHIGTNQTSGIRIRKLASRYLEDPLGAMSAVGDMSVANDMLNHGKAVNLAAQLARAGKLNPQQMGEVFGAVPDIFGEGWESMIPRLNPAEHAQIMKGGAVGYTQFFFGGPGGPGAGKRATIEPRMFELLGSPHLGALGPEMQKEIAERMMIANPARMQEQKILSESIESMLNPGVWGGATSAKQILGVTPTDALLPSRESILRIKGHGDIIIPGEGSISQLAGRKTASGKIIQSKLAGHYRDLIDVAAKAEMGQAAPEDVMGALNKLTAETGGAMRDTVTGGEGLLAGRISGSRFLTAVTPGGIGATRSPYAVGITGEMGGKMLTDLEQIYGVKEMAEIRQRFEQGGEVPGFGGRHPAISPYSIQPLSVYKVPGQGSHAVINEQLRKATAQIGGETVALGNLRFSPLVGMAADTDGDIMAVSMTSPKLAGSLSNHINNRASIEAYEEYTIRSQILKTKVASGGTTLQKEMAGAAMKLGIPDTELGKLSVNLSRAKSAVLSGIGGGAAEATGQSLALLDWLEQTPISGKHIPSERAAEMIDVFSQINRAVVTKNANLLSRTVQQVMASAEVAGQQMMGEGFPVALEDLASGEITQRRIKGIGLENTSKYIMESIQGHEAAAVADTSASKLHSLYSGRINPKNAEDVALMLSKSAQKTSPLGAFLPTIERKGLTGLMSNMVAQESAMMNRVAAAGGKVLKHAKPLGMGLAAAVGLAAVLSRPNQSLDMGANRPPAVDMRSGSGGSMMENNIHPSSQVSGSPSAPSHVDAGNTARVTSHRSMKNISIRGTSSGPVDYGAVNQQIRRAIGPARVHSSVSDRRSSLTRQKLSDILND